MATTGSKVYRCPALGVVLIYPCPGCQQQLDGLLAPCAGCKMEGRAAVGSLGVHAGAQPEQGLDCLQLPCCVLPEENIQLSIPCLQGSAS